MKKEFEKRNELIGLEEINQVETNEVNGGCCGCVYDPFPPGGPIYCLIDIPPKGPGDIVIFTWKK